jgi:fructose-1,6-bisphosphatase I/sedoheptulose-1,7-bisphosphatase
VRSPRTRSAAASLHACSVEGGEDSGYVVAFDALDGAANADVNVCVGSLFSVLRVPEGMPAEEAFLQPGARLVAAGYVIYGPATMLVLSVGNGTHAFTLERTIGEFLLTHPALSVPETTSEFAINGSHRRFWEQPVRRYVSECLDGANGPRGRDFGMRWIASLVAETHRILLRGGVFLDPRERREADWPGAIDLVFGAAPVAFLVEQAGGRASTGRARLLDVPPRALHDRTALVFGSREEVERIERYHAEEPDDAGHDLPLFQSRGLFRQPLAA